jgi:hypothetical protein
MMNGRWWILSGISHFFIYLIYLISHFFINLSRLHLFPLFGIVLGGQSTAMRRHCAPEGEAQPPHGGALPAYR